MVPVYTPDFRIINTLYDPAFPYHLTTFARMVDGTWRFIMTCLGIMTVLPKDVSLPITHVHALN